MSLLAAVIPKTRIGYHSSRTLSLYASIAQSVVSNLWLRTKQSNGLKGITPEEIIDTAFEPMKQLGTTEEQLTALRDAMLPLFIRPQEMTEDKE